MSTSTDLKKSTDAEFERIVDRRRRARMQKIDNLPAALRALVHEYGFCVVNAFIELEISNPRHIRHLVETVLNEFSPTRGSSSAQGTRADFGIRSDHHLNR